MTTYSIHNVQHLSHQTIRAISIIGNGGGSPGRASGSGIAPGSGGGSSGGGLLYINVHTLPELHDDLAGIAARITSLLDSDVNGRSTMTIETTRVGVPAPSDNPYTPVSTIPSSGRAGPEITDATTRKHRMSIEQIAKADYEHGVMELALRSGRYAACRKCGMPFEKTMACTFCNDPSPHVELPL